MVQIYSSLYDIDLKNRGINVVYVDTTLTSKSETAEYVIESILRFQKNKARIKTIS